MWRLKCCWNVLRIETLNEHERLKASCRILTRNAPTSGKYNDPDTKSLKATGNDSKTKDSEYSIRLAVEVSDPMVGD